MQGETLNSRLRTERERLGISQQDCASIADVGLSTWKRWEKDQAIPSDKLEILVGRGFDLLYLVTGIRTEVEIERRARITAVEAFERVIQALDSLGLTKSITAEALKPLVGHAFENRSTAEELKKLVETAYAIRGQPLPVVTPAIPEQRQLLGKPSRIEVEKAVASLINERKLRITPKRFNEICNEGMRRWEDSWAAGKPVPIEDAIRLYVAEENP